MELRHTAQRAGRLSSFLREEMAMSAGLMNRLKWADRILVNGAPQHTDFAVSPGDVITALLDEPQPEYPAQEGPLSILYEDEHILAVDKPAGILIHPSRSRMVDTLANWVVYHYEQTGQKSAFHPLTRLDRDTFGIVLLAKNSHVHALLSAGDTVKTYEALVYGQLPQPEGSIDAPIARLPLPSLLRQVRPDGKPSLTRYRVLEVCDSYSRVALQPITGRTHQLRVHCAHLGCPILGDPQYGSEASRALSQSLGYDHQRLCAVSLSFRHPITRQDMKLLSKLRP